MQKNNRIVIVGAVLLAVLLAVLGTVWASTRPAVSAGSKTITVEVIHKDESKKSFTYTTDEEYLDKVLVGEGLVEDNQGPYGLYIEEVDGERADYNVDGGYWSIEQNGERAATGATEIPVPDGDHFALIYTVG